jgi:hypothetical protein
MTNRTQDRKTVSVHGRKLRCDPILQDWLSLCPDLGSFVDLCERVHWQQKRVACSACGRKAERSALRWDTLRPLANPRRDMLCLLCWGEHSEAKVAWPKYVDRDERNPPQVVPRPVSKRTVEVVEEALEAGSVSADRPDAAKRVKVAHAFCLMRWEERNGEIFHVHLRPCVDAA